MCELRWKNGRRVYYAEIPEKQIILLLGGNKNGQDKDIRRAKRIFNKHVSSDEENYNETEKRYGASKKQSKGRAIG